MTPPDRSDFPGSKSPDRLQAFSGLLSDVSMLITELEDSQESRQADNTFTFELLGEHSVILPPQVLALLPDVDQVVVTIGKEETLPTDKDPKKKKSDKPIPPYLSITFSSKDALISVSRSSDVKNPDEPDVFIDLSSKAEFTPVPFRPLSATEKINSENEDEFSGRRIEIEKMSQKDINTLLMSLIYPDAERGYEMFEKIDLLRPDTHDDLMDSFQYAALGHQNSMTHRFTTGSTQFSFEKHEGEPVSFSVRYNETVVDEVGIGRPLVAFSNLETDFRLEFRTYEEQDEPLEGRTKKGVSVDLGSITVEGGKPYYPTTEDLQSLRSLLIEEIHAINPATVTLYQDTNVDMMSPDQTFEKSGKAGAIFSPSYLKKMLENLGFDSPDPGAA